MYVEKATPADFSFYWRFTVAFSPPNTDVFYKMSFYGTKATGNCQLNADVEVSLPTGTQVPGLPQSLLISWVLVQLMYFTVFRMLITVKTLPQTRLR